MMLILSALDHIQGSLFPVLPAVAQSAGTTLVTAVWQAALVAASLALTLKVARRTTASLRFSIWVAGFLTAVCLPFLPLFLPLLSSRFGAHPAIQAPSFAAREPSAWIHLDLRWSMAIALLWAASSIYRAVDLAVHAVRLRGLWKEATPVATERLHKDLAPLLEAGLWPGRRIQICTTSAQDRPSVIGFFAPRILIPEWLMDRLTPAELAQIVMHETEHLRRGDDWTNLLQKLGLVLFPLNPALLWMDRRLCLEREMACDEAVVRATRAPRAYAACLTNLAEHGRAWRHQAMERAALSLGAWRRRSELVGRVQSILRSKSTSETDFGTLHSKGIFAVLACGLLVGSVELARCPQLVAFVPAPSQQANELSAQVRPEQNLSGNVGQMQAVTTRDVSTAHMRNLKAIMPVRDSFASSEHSDIQPQQQGQRFKAQPIGIRKPISQNPERFADSLNGEISEATRAAGMRDPVVEPQQAGWLVLTTWEEVSTTNTDSPAATTATAVRSQTPSDRETASSGDLSSQQATQQIRVTRVVFRVVPASFVSPAPHVATTRDGWLVLQL